MVATMMNVPLSLNHIIERAGTLYGDVEVVSQMPDKSLRRHTYADLLRRSRSLAKALIDAGLKKGDRVATLMWNHHAHLEAYHGVPMAGGIYHTLNLRLAPADIAYIANHAKDRFLIVDDVLLKLYAAFAKDVDFEKVFVVSLTDAAVDAPFVEYESLMGEVADDWSPPEVDENQGAGMCYTSGTTGRPKGVVYSHRAICLHSFGAAMVDTLGINQADCILPMVPMFHANAWGLPFTCALTGAKQVHPGPHLDPESLLHLYEQEQVTMSAGVPTVWLGVQQLVSANPGKWKLQDGMRMVVGGSAAPEAMIRGMDKLGMKVVHAWGMTETTPLGTVATVKASLRNASADEQYAVRAKQGIPVPFVELRVIGDDGPVPADGTSMGELQVRGPWVASSYFDNPDAGDKWTDDGWFRTGDVVTIDQHGYMKITDRTKDLIKSGGEWISSVDLENALMGHPDVEEAAVIAYAHERWVERPLAVVVPREGTSLDTSKLNEFLLEAGIAKWWLPDGYVTKDAIPRTSTGKFMKAKLRDELAQWSPAQA
ncbi:MAG: long-chain fatty acid--CoA ligase [Myxococcota bacterium]